MAQGLTANELRTQTDDELVTKLKEAKEELFNLRFQAATGQLESHGRLRTVRHDIARIYTVMRERELGIVEVVETDETADTETDGAQESAKETSGE
ncbi:MAG: 50S ribosomal protein L29 [Streptosporangiales bacterium]|nr:50S ribosomal protein L29 [Streptosporangiales bacterium]